MNYLGGEFSDTETAKAIAECPPIEKEFNEQWPGTVAVSEANLVGRIMIKACKKEAGYGYQD